MVRLLLLALLVSFAMPVSGIVVSDESDGLPIVAATARSASGALIAFSDNEGRFPEFPEGVFPVEIGGMGYETVKIVAPVDTVRLTARPYQLPEVSVGTEGRDILHLVCYAREYLAATTDNDSIVGYMQYMVDFLIPLKKVKKFKGFSSPRTLSRQGIARTFDRTKGIDSISRNADIMEFSWFDFMSIDGKERVAEPESLRGCESGCDSVMGKYSVEKLYSRKPGIFSVVTDPLGNHSGHVWSPWFFKMLGCTIDMHDFRSTRVFMSNDTGKYAPDDLLMYSVSIDIVGRGKVFRKMAGSKSAVTMKSYFEIFPVSREYLTVEEAREVEASPSVGMEFVVPEIAPPLDEATLRMIERAEAM